MKPNSLLIAFLSILFLFGSCTYKNKLDLTTDECDVTVATYTKDVLPILQSKCYTCHSNGGLGTSKLNMDDFNDIRNKVAIISGVINWKNDFLRMPRGQAQLSECERDKIDTWINNGAKQD